MKSFALIFVALFVGTIANPAVPVESKQERIVTGNIESAIEDAAQAIKDAGLDPYEIESASVSYALSNEAIFAIDALVESLSFTGLSDISINNLNYSLLASRLTFDISFPRIALSIGNSYFKYTFFGRTREGSASGSLAIVQTRLSGNIRVNIGIISGISIRSISLDFDVENIESALNVVLFGYDFSEILNTYFGTTIPSSLAEFKTVINEFLENLVLQAAQ